ncbi:MAG TPA: ATP:cob(I)alamin adenosyltransferase, partial [Polyangiaceae bacterium]|nr:ATP:cob(I)alamin adenosyltransferase [Polyangiaceae bacterium]
MKIYTRTGDAGMTGLFGGGRVDKDAARVEAYGSVDELNACIGAVRATLVASELDGALAA